MKIDKAKLLMIASGIFGIGTLLVDSMSKKAETEEAAEKAADIVMERLRLEEKEQ